MMDWNNLILSRIKKILSSISSTQKLIGTTTDIGGNATEGTLMAKENAILDKLNSISNIENLLGNPNDTGGSQTVETVFGKENAILEALKNGSVPTVKSVQRSTVYTSDSYKTITISKVNPLKTIVLVNGGIPFGTASVGLPVFVSNLAETSVTVNALANGGITASIQVVEFC